MVSDMSTTVVFDTGGKPSTWFPPGVAENHWTLTSHLPLPPLRWFEKKRQTKNDCHRKWFRKICQTFSFRQTKCYPFDTAQRQNLDQVICRYTILRIYNSDVIWIFKNTIIYHIVDSPWKSWSPKRHLFFKMWSRPFDTAWRENLNRLTVQVITSKEPILTTETFFKSSAFEKMLEQLYGLWLQICLLRSYLIPAVNRQPGFHRA
jgi:hypothetical protein